jgi:beta-mannosidase
MIDLSGIWALSDESGQYQAPMAVPGDGISALHKAGLIPDPYWGRNEYGLRWIAERDWTIRREVVLERTDYAFVADMLDTVAEVRVNGVEVLKADSMFRRQRADVSRAAKVGTNVIEITFRSSVAEAALRQAAQPFYIPYSQNNCPIPNGNMLRKPQCDFGWDWNIALAPFGVYEGIRLETAARPRIGPLGINQHHESDAIELAVNTWLYDFPTGEPLEATVTCAGVTVRATVRRGRVMASLIIKNPELWWPAGQGAQALHDLTVRVGDVVETRRIGFRSFDLITEKDAAGSGFKFCVNGRGVFAKGANWIPQDALASNIAPEAARDLLQSAVDANMNMIRIWGGGRYEPDWFYDLCDEMGLMIWQDFMFACNLYPSTDTFLDGVSLEVEEQVFRLHHHACIALWCGDNELVGALNWFHESRENRDRYLVSYDRLNRTIEETLKKRLPDAIWWPSSPSPGPMSFGDAWHDDRSGDMHFWSVWHEGKDFDHYRDVSPRFCSEFGFQSYPSMSTIRKFADPKDWNISSPVMESHQKNAGGNARIAETMFRYFRFPVDFENFVYLSQVQQGIAIKTAVTHWRSLKPHCMGTLYWQMNDTWPVCSWSSLDHGGNWKLLHHMAKDFYAPVIVTAVPDGNSIVLRAVNDTHADVTLEVDVYAVTPEGSIRSLGTERVTAPPDRAVDVIRLASDTLKDDEILSFTWRQPGQPVSGDIHAPKPWKAYDLVPAGLTQSAERTDAGFTITVSAERLALFVSLESDVPGRFSDNAFTLFPGYPATIIFTPDDASAAPVFTLRDLHSATYGTERTP